MSSLEDSSNTNVKNQIQKFFSRTLIRLQSRMESVEVKVVSLSKVVRLLQQYSQKKDQQYEKQSNYMQVFQNKLTKIQEIQSQVSSNLYRYNDLSLKVQNHGLRLEQIQTSLQSKQAEMKETEQRFNYDFAQINKKIQKFESVILQQMRQSNKKQQFRKQQKNENYLSQEINFKINEIQNNMRNQFQRIWNKIDKISFNHPKNNKEFNKDYGLEGMNYQKQKVKVGQRKKGNSLLKRVKSK